MKWRGYWVVGFNVLLRMMMIVILFIYYYYLLLCNHLPLCIQGPMAHRPSRPPLDIRGMVGPMGVSYDDPQRGNRSKLFGPGQMW